MSANGSATFKVKTEGIRATHFLKSLHFFSIASAVCVASMYSSSVTGANSLSFAARSAASFWARYSSGGSNFSFSNLSLNREKALTP